MKPLTYFTACLLAGLVCTAPTSNEDKLVITDSFFPDSLVVYTSEHEIVNILLPLNSLNFDEDDDDEDSSENSDTVIFFVEADVDKNGDLIDKGLYILTEGNATKLLEHGRDAAAANDDSKIAFFAARDGLYIYNEEKNEAEKYGNMNESLISIAKVNDSDIIYAVSEDNFLYNITEEGTKAEKVNDVENVTQVVLDYENNLFFTTTDYKVYGWTPEGVKKIEGLPEHITYLNILKPPFIFESGVPVIANNQSHIAYVNGTSELGEFEFEVMPTAFAMEGTLIQYFAYNKKIYEYNILSLLFNDVLADFKNFLNDNSDDIQSIATRSRNDLRS